MPQFNVWPRFLKAGTEQLRVWPRFLHRGPAGQALLLEGFLQDPQLHQFVLQPQAAGMWSFEPGASRCLSESPRLQPQLEATVRSESNVATEVCLILRRSPTEADKPSTEGNSELWQLPAAPSVYDEEFNGLTIPSPWQRNYTPGVTAVDDLATFDDAVRESWNGHRRSHFAAQVPHTSGPDFAAPWFLIYRDFDGGAELPDGTYWCRLFSPYVFGGVVQADSEVQFSLYADSGGQPDNDNRVTILPKEHDNNAVTTQSVVWTGGSEVTTFTTDQEATGNHFQYAAIIKDGSTVHTFAGSNAGAWTWMQTATLTYSVKYVAIGYDNSDATPLMGNPVCGVDFFRYTAAKQLP